MLVVTMCEPPLASPQDVDDLRAAVAAIRPDLPVVTHRLSPAPGRAGGRGAGRVLHHRARRRASRRSGRSLEADHGADVVAVSGSLSDRAALRADLDRPDVAGADTYLTEIKAAAIDVVAEAGRGARRAARLLRQPAAGDGRLAATWTPRCAALADEVVAAHA